MYIIKLMHLRGIYSRNKWVKYQFHQILTILTLLRGRGRRTLPVTKGGVVYKCGVYIKEGHIKGVHKYMCGRGVRDSLSITTALKFHFLIGRLVFIAL